VKLSLYFIKYALYHEDVWGSGDVAPSFLTSALDGCEWPVSRLRRFTPLRYPLDKKLFGSQNRSERYGEKKTLSMSGIEHRPSRSIMNANSEYAENTLSSTDINIYLTLITFTMLNKNLIVQRQLNCGRYLSKTVVIQPITKILQNETEF
jgi:hypothetical protein